MQKGFPIGRGSKWQYRSECYSDGNGSVWGVVEGIVCIFSCWLGSLLGDMDLFWFEKTGRLGVL